MAGLRKIRDLALQYSVTPRTLRYYEEIGLLWSERTEDSAYRSYEPAAIERLEQILLLRKLQLPIRDIQAIFAAQDLQVAVDTFSRKLKAIDAEMTALVELRETVSAFLELLREKGIHRTGGLTLPQEERLSLAVQRQEPGAQLNESREVESMANELTHVRIVELKPVRVAWYRAESTTPEDDAWSVMKRWVEEQGLQHLATTRYFGFDTSLPAPNNPVYGYEVWVTLPEGLTPTGPVGVKEFSGGLYAVISSYGHEIPERWQQLVAWVKASDRYELGSHPCMEETVTPFDAPDGEWQLDLMEPIVRK